jgi:hypothetical protein
MRYCAMGQRFHHTMALGTRKATPSGMCRGNPLGLGMAHQNGQAIGSHHGARHTALRCPSHIALKPGRRLCINGHSLHTMHLLEINRRHTHGSLNQGAVGKDFARLITRPKAKVKR